MVGALSVSSSARHANQELGSDDGQTATAASSAPVEIDGRSIFLVHSSIGGLSAEERAETIEQRIVNIARRNEIRVEEIHAEDRGAWTEILAGNGVVLGVTENDARAAGRSRAQLGAEYAEIIRRTVATFRQEHTWRALLRGVIACVIATAGLLLSVLLLLRVRRMVRSRLEMWIRRTADANSPNSVRPRIARYLLLPLLGTGAISNHVRSCSSAGSLRRFHFALFPIHQIHLNPNEQVGYLGIGRLRKCDLELYPKSGYRYRNSYGCLLPGSVG